MILLTIVFTSLFSDISAHHTGDHSVTLHLTNSYDECAMFLDPSLTQSAFREFVREVGPIIYFKPISSARPLGKFNFDLGLEYQKTSPLEDYKSKWNDTFAHPDSDHYLVPDNHRLSLPLFHARMGVTDKMDMEMQFTKNFASNYGWVGGGLKYGFYYDAGSGLAGAARTNYSSMLGVSDLNYHHVGADLLVSKDLWLFRPYAGVAFSLGYMIETTSKVNLKNETVTGFEGILGTEFVWKYLSIALEADFAVINMYTFKVGGNF